MKKVIIALSAIVILAAAVVFVVNAQDTKTSKKGTTEVTGSNKSSDSKTCEMSMKNCKSGGSCCKSATGSDSTKCKMSGGAMSQQMSCCKGKSETASVSGTGCKSTCPMKSQSNTK